MTVSTSLLPYSSSVQFSGGIGALVNGPETLEITQEEYAHDTATMTFWGGDVGSTALQSGMPMLISWGLRGEQRIFYGYVNHSRRTNNSLSSAKRLTERNATTVTAVGASWPMKAVGSQSWTGYTASQVAQEIATQFHLAAQITQDSTVWSSLQMSGRSYFQFMVYLAKKIGYTFYVNGVQLVFKPRQTNPNNLASLSAVYDYRANPAAFPLFSPVVGANNPSGGQLRNRTLAGINPRTNQVVLGALSGNPAPTTLGTFSDTPLFNTVEHAVANSQAEVTAKLSGIGAYNQLYITATARAVGDPSISQGSLVFVENANGGENGLWFVGRALHRLDLKTYSLSLGLGRDSMGVTSSVSTAIQNQSLPLGALNGSTWVAV